MDCWEGYLSGQVNIDYHHGFQVIAYTEEVDGSDITFYIAIGDYWNTEWGVFVNGTLVAETGPLKTYGHNVVLPFGLGVGTGKATITIGWKATTTNDIFAGKYPNDQQHHWKCLVLQFGLGTQGDNYGISRRNKI